MGFLMIWLSVLCALKSSAETISKFERLLKYDNYDVLNNTYISQGGKIQECAETCAYQPNCSLFYHNPVTLFCKLYALTLLPDHDLSAATLTPGSRYYQRMTDWCPDTGGWNTSVTVKVCFKVSDEKLNWEDARSKCQEQGGDLIVLHQILKQALVTERVQSIATLANGVWLGINDIETEGAYTWIDGTPIPSENMFWNDAQPNGGTTENCGMLANGQLFDSSCSDENRFICEKKA